MKYKKESIFTELGRNNLLFQRFLGLDQASKNINSHPLITQRLNLTSYRDESRKFESSCNSRQNLEEENSNVDQMSQTLKADQTSRSREPLNIFAITSPKAMGVRNLPPQSPKTFINVWADKPDSKENKVPR